MSRTGVTFSLAALFAALAVLTLIVPDWIEVVFGVEPDAGSGSLEWAIALVFGVLAVLSGLLGRRQLRAARETMTSNSG